MELKRVAALISALFLATAFLRAQDTANPSSTPSASPSPTASPSNPVNPVNPVQTPSSPSPPIITAQSTVVPTAKLTGVLPEAPVGWTSDKPDSSTSNTGGFPITTVSRVYAKGDADDAPTATINIIDSANNQQFQDSTKAIWNATSNTAEGYDKTVTIDGLPGFEHFSNADQTGVLWVVCGHRFFVQIETTRLPPSELEAWLPRIDLKKLATLR